MTAPVEAARPTPVQRAAAIYSSAHAELAGRLWRAALGGDRAADAEESPGASAQLVSPARTYLSSLLSLLPSPPPIAVAAPPARAAVTAPAAAMPPLGANARYAPALAAAAERTGLPPKALTAIINAEAAKAPDGSWLTYSRNPRSSAAGLGQFLSGTWEGMASTTGTWLNGVARANGWLNAAGQVLPNARSALLALRYDGEASIRTIADYARQNLDAFKRAGVAIGDGAESVARAAYIGHQLGLGDGIRFLKDGLDSKRARHLLNAQIGPARASARIADAGDAAAAHRNWLLDFVSRRVRAGD